MTNQPSNCDKITAPAILSGVWLGVMAPQAVLVMPYIVSDLASRLHLSIVESGFFASAALTGACLSGILQAAIVTRISTRSNAVFFAALLSLSFAALASTPSLWVSVVAMFVAGAGIGALLALAFTALEQTSQQTRGVGLMFGVQAGVGSLLAAIVPALGAIDSRSIYYTLIATSVSVLLAAPYLPGQVRPATAAARTAVTTGGASRSDTGRLIRALTGWGLINFATGGFWPLIGELSRETGHSSILLSGGVSAALICSIAGGFGAAMLGRRLGGTVPLVMIGIGTVLSNIGIAGTASSSTFLLSMALFGFMWNFGPPYQLPVISGCDGSGRGMSLALVFMKLFMAVAPAIYGLVAEHAGSLATGVLAAGMAGLSTLLLVGLSLGISDNRGRRSHVTD